MRNPMSPGEKLATIMRALADHAGSTSDKNLLDEAAADGVDVKEQANRVRTLLLDSVLRAKKKRLSTAALAHEATVTILGSRTSRVPSDAALRRALLAKSLRRRPQMREAVVTLQHREFESFSDADVESALRQMDALGLLDDDSEQDS
ncbi:MAG: hypothetical protein ACLP66_03375 [Polyangia bacterium]